MFRTTFNPGPSQITNEVKADIAEASRQNIIGISHRSPAFIDITREAAEGLRKYFKVPADYHIVFTSSATEAMELIIRNLIEKESFHFTNGHFSELFARVSQSFGKTAVVDTAEWGKQNDHEHAQIPSTAEIIALTYNETSTGVICTNQTVRGLHKKDPLLVVDITSVAGCVPVEIDQADVWFFSVQKGMGLPSGLGVIFISPRAMERAKRLKHAGLFNFAAMVDKMLEHQTLQTPNVLGIYLLAKQLTRWKADPDKNYRQTEAKARLLDDFVNSHKNISYFVNEPAARSKSTVCLETEPALIKKMHDTVKAADLVLGTGYGKLKETTCRIATFPALTTSDIQELISILSPVVS